jgi:hypothetical protein
MQVRRGGRKDRFDPDYPSVVTYVVDGAAAGT